LPAADHGDILALGRSLAAAGGTPPDHVVAENDRPVNGVELMKAQFPNFDVSKIDRRIRTLITPRYKLVWHLPDRTELFDLEADPGELVDLSTSKKDVRDRMLETLARWTKITTESLQPVDAFRGGDEAARERLKGLTYVK